MCREMESMLEDVVFNIRLNHILLSMKKLGWTKEQALEFYEFPRRNIRVTLLPSDKTIS